jgi:hypothetical protein
VSSLSKKEVAVRARQYLTERDEALAGFTVPMLVSLVDDALSAGSEQIAADPQRRHLLRTDPETTTIEVVDNVADLTDLLTVNRVIMEFIRSADIKGENERSYQFVASMDALRTARRTDRLFTFCVVEGTSLYTRKDTLLEGHNEEPTVSANFYATLAEWPDSENPRLIALVAQLAMASMTAKQQKIATAVATKNAT